MISLAHLLYYNNTATRICWIFGFIGASETASKAIFPSFKIIRNKSKIRISQGHIYYWRSQTKDLCRWNCNTEGKTWKSEFRTENRRKKTQTHCLLTLLVITILLSWHKRLNKTLNALHNSANILYIVRCSMGSFAKEIVQDASHNMETSK